MTRVPDSPGVNDCDAIVANLRELCENGESLSCEILEARAGSTKVHLGILRLLRFKEPENCMPKLLNILDIPSFISKTLNAFVKWLRFDL